MRPTVDQIASFFDEVDEIYLTPFDWNPNEKLPSHGRTYRLKDRFRVRYKGMICIYDDIDDCRVMFHSIFWDNIRYVYQCQDLLEKIKKITNPENYDVFSESKQSGISTNKNTNEESSTNSGMNFLDDKDGSISGSGESTTSSKQYNTKFQALVTKGILDKTEDAIMQVIDPNARSISQTYKRNKSQTGELKQAIANSNSLGLTGYKNETSNVSRVIASNEMRALAVGIPKLAAEFLECFNALFYY